MPLSAERPGMERLGHGAEVLAQARRLAGADAERAARLLDVEAQHARRARGGGDRADGGRGVEAVVVVPRVDRFRDLGLDFHAELVGGQHVEPRAVAASRPAPARAAAPARWGA